MRLHFIKRHFQAAILFSNTLVCLVRNHMHSSYYCTKVQSNCAANSCQSASAFCVSGCGGGDGDSDGAGGCGVMIMI